VIFWPVILHGLIKHTNLRALAMRPAAEARDARPRFGLPRRDGEQFDAWLQERPSSGT
jgi:hypothetical protein